MRLLTRHVSKAVAVSISMVLLVIVAIDGIAVLIDGVGDLRNEYDFSELLIYIGLTMPERIYQNIPMSSLIGCIVGLGAMASNSELTVMRSSGVSLMQMVGMILRPVLVLIVVGLCIGEYLTPYTEQLAESRRSMMRSHQNVQDLASGVWNKEGNEFMHFSAVYPGGILYGVSRYHFDNQHRLQQVSYAEQVTYDGDYWREDNGQVTTFLGNRTVASSFKTRRWNSSLTPELLQYIVLSPDSLGIKSLYHYSAYLDKQGSDSSRHKLSFWSKALQPLTVASLVLVAISFVFGPLRQVTMGFRVFVGVLVGVVVNTAQEMLGPASLVFGFSPFLAVFIPAVLLIVVGIHLLRRTA